ncbi:type VI secretion system lipoprotein TssJ [Pseudomonas caspiana]|uniref:type VI secretion system lipoprotein TssJ n=1 Tax=Pseudomonas caspiana TaxID=1451454 RepID=UPI0032F00DF7
MLKINTLATLAITLLLVGCTALSPYSTQTRLELKLAASDQLNPDINARPSPVVLRLLELKNPVLFMTADFFSLYGQPKVVLAPDLVAIEEMELRPGEQLQFKLHVQEGSRYVGVLAAYRDLPETKWRYVIQLVPGETNRAQLTLDHAGIHDSDDAFNQADRQ